MNGRKSNAEGPKIEDASSIAVRQFAKLIFHVVSLALHGALSQLLLSPVYGSVNAATYHGSAQFVGNILGWIWLFLSRVLDPGYRPLSRLATVISPETFPSVYPVYIPFIHSIIGSYSDQLGLTWGPCITDYLTLTPLHLAFTVYTGNWLFRSCDRSVDTASAKRKWTFVAALPVLGDGIIRLDKVFVPLLPRLALFSVYLTRVWLSLAISLAGLTQSSVTVALAALPGISYTLQYNPHLEWRPFRRLPSIEHLQYSLIDRRESITGYISILENNELSYRVLRCDHSLLGGEWLVTDAALARGITGTEPVYAVFEMLEAVRLMQTTSTTSDSDKTALVIGLGVGTAPKALLAHGIDTTIVELDPVVHEFATKYFDLPTNHTAYIEDAISWTQTRAVPTGPRYDYILHDVFTGGVEPLALFTESFIANLRTLLLPDGAIAINFAGSVHARPAKQVLHTIDIVFEGRCRIFRDLQPDGPDEDFSNMVVFCLGSGAPRNQKPEFREPVEADFLGSVSRREQLVPKSALEIAFPSVEDMRDEAVQVLTEDNMWRFNREQSASARQHWEVMRQVVPPKVWEMW